MVLKLMTSKDNESLEIPDPEDDGKEDDDDEDDGTDGFVFQRIPRPPKGVIIKEPSTKRERTSKQQSYQSKGKAPGAEGMIDQQSLNILHY
ncbi:hypothetical protein L6452_19413 [Arctium lappa]|uniref:Uncharacterized protein n=1 Tax=Arctium lappa TaxID=4217 RepID=A0ACB9B9C4_ARCLA|nr:hypothetical protein L6452_19413 [Arctium lappa]